MTEAPFQTALEKTLTPRHAVFETGHRVCESCGGAMPSRMHRQRNEKGQLVCDNCKSASPRWSSAHASTLMLVSPEDRAEFFRREAEAVSSILRISRMRDTAEAIASGQTHLAHDMGDGGVVNHCFAGETEYLTRDGVKTLAETVGTTQWVLTSPRGEKSPRWVQAEIRDFGVQPLLKVVIQRNQRTKEVYATAQHRWLVGRTGSERVVHTEDLRNGHRLMSLKTPGVDPTLQPDHAGIRHGVVFGDGTAIRGRWAKVTLWGEKDKQLLEYFPDTNQTPKMTPGGVHGVCVIGGLTADLKTVPSLEESDEYLYGWLAGYFAADGNVTKQGQVVLDCVSEDTLLAVRDIATRLGISVYGITTRYRQGYGIERRPISRMEFVGSTLTEDFFLIEQHRERFQFRAYSYDRLGWTVVRVVPTDRVEAVYCAVVPETESFVLADNIWTGNCPFCGSGAVVGGSDGSVECGFCHTVFSVQVQPNNPSMPQTVNGQPFVPPGMPAGEPTEMSEPKDPVAEQADQQDGEDPSGAQQPGHPSSGDPNPSSADMISDRQANPPIDKAKQDKATDDATKTDKPGDSGGDKNSDNPFAKNDDDAGRKATSPVKDADTPVDPHTLKKVDDEDEEEVDDDDLVLVKKKKAASAGWETFRFYHNTLTGYRKMVDGRKIEIIPTNGRRGSWDVMEDDNFIGETFGSPQQAMDWIDNPGAPDPRLASVLGSFRTPDGTLSGDAYLKRLALQFADDRAVVLAEIRSEGVR